MHLLYAAKQPERHGNLFLSISCAREVGSLTWHLCVDGALPGALNMARDHALALSLVPGSAALRLYRWERPTLSLGRNEPARGNYDSAVLQRAGVDVVRRPTGGRAVLHWRELTYAVAVPATPLGGARAAYGWINICLAEGLASLGIPAEIAPEPHEPTSLRAGPCFQVAAGGEVTAGGRKLVGSAQVRVRNVLLQHGSILVADDQGLLAGLGGGVVRAIDRPATLESLLGRRPADGELEGAVLGAFRRAGADLKEGTPSSGTVAELEELYRSDAWTWRR